MAEITLIHGNAFKYKSSPFAVPHEMVLTDPPFEMPGRDVARLISDLGAPHLVLIATMRQVLEFAAFSDYRLAFDFVLDNVAPRKSMNAASPHYTHATGVYMTAPKVRSAFNRKRRARSDLFADNGYWPTIFHAPRERMATHGMAKSSDCITDILGAFDIDSVIDPFAGSGTTGLAATELELRATLIERDGEACADMKRQFLFLMNDLKTKEIIE